MRWVRIILDALSYIIIAPISIVLFLLIFTFDKYVRHKILLKWFTKTKDERLKTGQKLK